MRSNRRAEAEIAASEILSFSLFALKDARRSSRRADCPGNIDNLRIKTDRRKLAQFIRTAAKEGASVPFTAGPRRRAAVKRLRRSSRCGGLLLRTSHTTGRAGLASGSLDRYTKAPAMAGLMPAAGSSVRRWRRAARRLAPHPMQRKGRAVRMRPRIRSSRPPKGLSARVRFNLPSVFLDPSPPSLHRLSQTSPGERHRHSSDRYYEEIRLLHGHRPVVASFGSTA
jgi:hypothetical protein